MEDFEEKEIKLVPKKDSFITKLKGVFENKKRRYLYLFLFVLPFLIVIGLFGFVAFKEAKGLVELLQGSTEVKNEFKIDSMNYVLRDNATEVQQQYFAELKQAIEVDNAPDKTIAGLICKNYVADMYTWTNKQGQYDVGGMYYVFDLEETKTNSYMQVRDTFYKYLSNYINEYGASNLIEVENVEVTKAQELGEDYICLVNTHGYTDELGHFYYDADHTYEYAWSVTCNWAYKESAKFDTSKFATSMNFIVVLNNGRYEIVEASEKPITLKEIEIPKDDDEEDINENEELEEDVEFEEETKE